MPDDLAPDAPSDGFALASRATPLAPVIAEAIHDGGGRITFERFMALALGHPQHGYYSRERLRWGAEGDYETSPEVHSIFGYLWARQIEQCWERLGRPDPYHVVEPGAGSGAFAVAILTWLRERAPACARAVRFVLLDGHQHRLSEQRRALEAAGMRAEHVLIDEWLGRAEAVTGVLISNEFFDALPVHLVERRGEAPHQEALHEWYVAAAPGGGLTLQAGPPSTPALADYFDRLGILPGDGCRAELSLAAVSLMAQLSARLHRGYVITIDYGAAAAELYASWRRMGTLMAFRDHTPRPDPLAEPGLLDLTAHVDFTSLAAASGLPAAPLVSQAEALVALGIGEALEASQGRAAQDLARYASDRRAVETLLDPAGLGRIRVLVQAKDAPLDGLHCLRPVVA